MAKPAVVVENLSKVYRIGLAEQRSNTLVGAITSTLRAPLRNFRNLYRLGSAGRDGDGSDTIRAVDDVSFEVLRGEVLGVIGRNGAGKSTLLKILSRITKPTTGRIRIRGRVSSLLEVGTGFHPELTGRENVYLNGTILGMTKREIDRKFDEIVAFSGVAKFIDTPVKRYSSGMKVRLAFAVAAHLDPEILIVDEVLAVGDANYQRKCIDRMQEIASSGRTILFVSHNMDLIPRLCDRAILLVDGQLAESGNAQDVVNSYIENLIEMASSELMERQRSGSGVARFARLRILDVDGRERRALRSMDDMVVEIEIESSIAIPDAAIAINIHSLRGHKVITSWTKEADFPVALRPGVQSFRCQFRSLPLRPGSKACIHLWLGAAEVLDSVENAAVIDVVDGTKTGRFSNRQDQGLILCDYHYEQL